ncbi:MAG: ATP-binding protein [Treponema sp.]|jgi:anti-sigma regulatory factor (Ser/Thr protein kinase)|nr:ATP-binding protein [Treponema sp.]
MGILGVINSDPEIKKLIETAVQDSPKHEYFPRYFSEEEDILEFLNYELPEIVIINFSDPKINIDKIVSHIQNDKLILNFGIVGIFSGNKDNEEAILKKYKTVNILTLLDNYRLRTHLIKNIQIIEQNYQLIFQREFSKNLLEGVSGSFIIDNDILAVPLYAGIGATILAQRGLINPDHKMHLQLALSELIVNAIEHGNCGITYDEKTMGMENGFSVVELVMERCKDPLIKKKKVEFLWDIQAGRTAFTIRDEGKGFNVKAHLRKIAGQDVMSLHGRGIKMASMLSTELKYNDKGNEVTLLLKHDASVEHEVPIGFSLERIIEVKKGDIVLREDEPSDYLYYIISGNYSVFHNLKKVGSLSPQDIFMGEIAFLLNQRRSASVQADGQGKLVLLTRKTLVSIIRQYPHYGIFLSKLLARRLVRANDQNASLLARFTT